MRLTRILENCDHYRGDQDRLRAFVLVMRHSGMRIGDTIALDEQRLKENKLLLYTAKTGTPVSSHAFRSDSFNYMSRRLISCKSFRLLST